MLPLVFQLPANESQRHSRVGRTVFVKSATAEIEVTGYSEGGIIVGKARMVAGNRYMMAADFVLLEVRDVSGATNNVDMLAGLGDFSEAGLGTIDSITNPVNTRIAWPTAKADSETAFLSATTLPTALVSAAANVNGVELLNCKLVVSAGGLARVDLDNGPAGWVIDPVLWELDDSAHQDKTFVWNGSIVVPADVEVEGNIANAPGDSILLSYRLL